MWPEIYKVPHMRHLWSLTAGVVIAPIVWAFAAFGEAVSDEVFKNGPIASFSSKLLFAAAAFVVAGLLVGLIGSLRVSPVGPVVAGLAYLACYALVVFAPKTANDIFGRHSSVAGYDADIFQPLRHGIIPILGAMLLMTVFSAGRWRTWPRPVTADVAAETPTGWTPTTPAPVSTSPAGTEPTSPAPVDESRPISPSPASR
jgi:hypothetical protein